MKRFDQWKAQERGSEMLQEGVRTSPCYYTLGTVPPPKHHVLPSRHLGKVVWHPCLGIRLRHVEYTSLACCARRPSHVG